MSTSSTRSRMKLPYKTFINCCSVKIWAWRDSASQKSKLMLKLLTIHGAMHTSQVTFRRVILRKWRGRQLSQSITCSKSAIQWFHRRRQKPTPQLTPQIRCTRNLNRKISISSSDSPMIADHLRVFRARVCSSCLKSKKVGWDCTMISIARIRGIQAIKTLLIIALSSYLMTQTAIAASANSKRNKNLPRNTRTGPKKIVVRLPPCGGSISVRIRPK